jgi:hypothetical protein
MAASMLGVSEAVVEGSAGISHRSAFLSKNIRAS